MVVSMSRISKANVCPYNGSEIPNSEKLGLDPNKVYRLYRDPKEFANGTMMVDGQEVRTGAWSWDGKPLILKHNAITADAPEQQLWVGTLGACTFEEPYLVTRPLTVITAEAQALIEADEQRELSAGYRYTADMTPGTTPDGESFDGRMTQLRGNHVAIVREGRAGSDVHVADELPLEMISVKNRKLIARLQKKIPVIANLNAADLLAFDEELSGKRVGEVPPKSTLTLTKDERDSACDAARDAKRRRHGADAELSEEERKKAIDAATDKKRRAHNAERARDAEKRKADGEFEASDEARRDEEEEAEDESEEERDRDEEAEDSREEASDAEKDDEEARDRRKARDERRRARDRREGARDARREGRDERRDARDERREGRDEKREADGEFEGDRARDSRRARDKRRSARDARRARDEERDDREEEAEDSREEVEDEKRKADGEFEAGDARREAEDRKRARDSRHRARDERRRARDALADEDDHRRDFRSGDSRRGRDGRRAHDSMTMDEVRREVSRAQAATAAQVRAEQRALAVAVDEVAPLVGRVQMHAFDSAAEVYSFALEKIGAELDDDFPEAALHTLVKNELRHREAVRKPTRQHAYDSAGSGFNPDELFQRTTN